MGSSRSNRQRADMTLTAYIAQLLGLYLVLSGVLMIVKKAGNDGTGAEVRR